MKTKEQREEVVTSIQRQLLRLSITNLDKYDCISYGKLYGACYLWSDLKNEGNKVFYFNFIKEYAKELKINI